MVAGGCFLLAVGMVVSVVVMVRFELIPFLFVPIAYGIGFLVAAVRLLRRSARGPVAARAMVGGLAALLILVVLLCTIGFILDPSYRELSGGFAVGGAVLVVLLIGLMRLVGRCQPLMVRP